MNLKNLNVNKTLKILKLKLSNKKIFKLFNIFEKDFDVKKRFVVAVSGGPDSLALAFFTKLFSPYLIISAVAYVSSQLLGIYEPVPITSTGALVLANNKHFSGLKPDSAQMGHPLPPEVLFVNVAFQVCPSLHFQGNLLCAPAITVDGSQPSASAATFGNFVSKSLIPFSGMHEGI